MANPRQVRVEIKYDGTDGKIKVASTVSTASESITEGGINYTVVRGDTLWAIAKKHLGEGSRYTVIYDANKETIEATAKAHGKPNSDHGHWIWAGEVLFIPIGTTEASRSSYLSSGQSTREKLGNKIERQLSSFSYTDVASGQSDSVSLTMHDIGKEWMGAYMPQRGASLGAKIVPKEWEKLDPLDCGRFVLDDISFSGPQITCSIGGVSVPAMDDFKSLPRTQTYEKTTVRQIASQVASRAKISLVYEASDVQIAEIEQKKKTDSAFLYELCEKYGLAMKVYNKKIVIFDMAAYESKKAVLTLEEGKNLIDWSYNTTVDGTYTGVELSYTDPDKSTIKVTIGTQGRMYSLNTQASSRYDAELQAEAKVNEANRSAETMTVSVFPCSLVATQCVNIKGLGRIDGKYFIDKIKHDIGSSGYKMQLTLHKVQKLIKA